MGRRSREKKERRLELLSQSKTFLAPRFNLEKICFEICRWGTYLILFTPLVVIRSSFFPFVTPKTIFFRILAEIIFVAYLFLAITYPRYRPKINTLIIVLGLFLAILILTSFTGINFERSFWSTYERMTGLWTFFHLFAFFIVLSNVFKERKDWERILGVSVMVGVLLSLYVLFGNEMSTRGGGTIGNTSFMGAFLLFSIFFALILFSNNLFKKNWGWLICWGSALGIMLYVLITSSARGAILSFFGGLFLLILGYMIFSGNKFLKRTAWGVILGLIIFISISLIFQPYLLKNKIDYILTEMKSRFVVWEMGWKGWQERVWFGWGPENFNVIFNKYFNPCLFLSECGGEVWFDRAHNIVFDTLTTSGLIGLMGYLTIFGVAIYKIIKILPKVAEKRNIFFPLGVGVLLIVYFVQNLLVFDMISSYLMFFLSLGFISFLVYPPKEGGSQQDRNPLTKWWLWIIVGIIVLTFWFGNIQPAQSGRYIAKMVNPNLKIEESQILFQKSLKSLMLKYEPREQFAKRVALALNDPKQNKKALLESLELAAKEMEKSIEKNPLDFRPHLFLGKIYIDFYYFNKDKEKLNLAEKILKKAIELSPKNQQGYWNLAQVKIYQRKYSEAIDLLQKAVDLEPRLGRSQWYLALAFKAAGKNQAAKEKLIEAEKKGYNWEKNLTDFKKVIELYLALKDNQMLISLYQKAIEIWPRDPQLWAGLAATYARLGEKEKAKEAAAKVVEIEPNLLPQTERFLKSLEEERGE